MDMLFIRIVDVKLMEAAAVFRQIPMLAREHKISFTVISRLMLCCCPA